MKECWLMILAMIKARHYLKIKNTSSAVSNIVWPILINFSSIVTIALFKSNDLVPFYPTFIECLFLRPFLYWQVSLFCPIIEFFSADGYLHELGYCRNSYATFYSINVTTKWPERSSVSVSVSGLLCCQSCVQIF